MIETPPPWEAPPITLAKSTRKRLTANVRRQIRILSDAPAFLGF
jgi:hypothetical protein